MRKIRIEGFTTGTDGGVDWWKDASVTDVATGKTLRCPLARFAPCYPECVGFTVYDGREDHPDDPVDVVCRAMGNVMLIGVIEKEERDAQDQD